jgi:hypothetical protein
METAWWERLGGGDGLVVRTAWWWERLDDGDGLVMRTTWWWGRLGGEDGLVVGTAWWWGRLASKVIRGTIYLPTLNWADKEFFLTFPYIASLGQAWQNPSDTNPRVGLRALISPTRSDTNPRVGFELLSETQPYGQATVFWVNDLKDVNCRFWVNRRAVIFSFSDNSSRSAALWKEEIDDDDDILLRDVIFRSNLLTSLTSWISMLERIFNSCQKARFSALFSVWIVCKSYFCSVNWFRANRKISRLCDFDWICQLM